MVMIFLWKKPFTKGPPTLLAIDLSVHKYNRKNIDNWRTSSKEYGYLRNFLVNLIKHAVLNIIYMIYLIVDMSLFLRMSSHYNKERVAYFVTLKSNTIICL